MLPLSQSHLSLLERCARQYEYVFFDSLTGPSDYEQQTKAQWGSQFHLLMQQQALNLPIEVLASADLEMSASLSSLQAAAPDVFQHLLDAASTTNGDLSHTDSFSQSEHRRTLSFNGYLLTAAYDLVVIQSAANHMPAHKKGLIFDWKTHQQPPQKERLRRDWQTRLYQYLLCETSPLSPEEISMTYWFVRAAPADKSQPSFYRFDYDLAEHDQTRQDLQALTDRLNTMRQSGQFPKVEIEKGLCDRCPFNVRCDRLSAPQASSPPPNSQSIGIDPYQLVKTAHRLNIEDIPEIPL